MDAIDACIGHFVPRSLPEGEWSLVADAARAVVRDAEPPGPEHARNLLSRLCIFLADSVVWDHRSVPDLADLLTEDAIRAHCLRLAQRLSPGSVKVFRTDLWRVASAAQAWRLFTGRLPDYHVLEWAGRRAMVGDGFCAALAAAADTPPGPGLGDRAVTTRQRPTTGRQASRAAAIRRAEEARTAVTFVNTPQ